MKENQENKKKYQNEDIRRAHDFEDETNFGRVLRDPIRMFGGIYPYFIVVLVAGGIFWLNNMDQSFLNAKDGFLPPETNSKKEIPMKKGGETTGGDLEEIAGVSPEVIAKGEELYKTTCSSCHGDNGQGDGLAAAALNPKPQNFHEADGWVNGHDLVGLFKTMKEGIPGSGMAAYDFMSVKDRFAIIHYIRTMGDFYGETTTAELQKVDDEFNITEGSVTPSTIPVELAMKLMAEESKSSREQISKLEKNIENRKSDPGYAVFSKVTDNENQALASLLHNTKWQAGKEQLRELIAATFPANGFKASALKLSDSELQSLFDFAFKLISPNFVPVTESVEESV